MGTISNGKKNYLMHTYIHIHTHIHIYNKNTEKKKSTQPPQPKKVVHEFCPTGNRRKQNFTVQHTRTSDEPMLMHTQDHSIQILVEIK